MSAAHRARRGVGVATVASSLLLALGAVPASPLDPDKAIKQYLIDWWDESAGLPQNNVKLLLQTRDGYLWIGTKGGLARFDGVRFVSYDDRSGGQLQESEVWALAQAQDGALWIGTYGGGLTHLQGGRSTTYRAGQSGLVGDFVVTLANASDGGVWVGTERGLCHFKDDRFSCYGTKDGLPAADVRALHLAADGALWIGTGGGLARLGPGGIVSYASRFPGRLDRRVASLAGDTAGGLWIGTFGSGLIRMQGESLTEYGLSDGLPSAVVNTLLTDSHGALWIGTNGGLARFSNGHIQAYFSDFAIRSNAATLETVSLRDIQALALDREGSLWIGTTLDGLARLRDGVFEHMRQAEGLPDDNVRTICEDESGAILVGTAAGLARFAHGKAEVFKEAQGFATDSIQTVAADGAGGMWIGTTRGLYQLRGAKIERLPARELENLGIQAVISDGAGGLWIGTQDDALFHYRAGRVEHFVASEGLAGRQIRALVRDNRGRLWVGTKDGGLSRLEGNRLVNVPLGGPAEKSSVHALFADDDGALWAATRHGLKRVKDGQVATLTAEQGLASNFIYQFVDDGHGDLWMTYGSGIMRASKRALNAVADGTAAGLTCVAYGTAQGLQSTAMSVGRQNGAYRSRDGRLWFATGRGVAVVDPSRIPVNTLPPPVWIEGISVDGQARGLAARASFDPPHDRVELRYTALSFLSPDRVRFQRMLEGFDDHWLDAATQRTADYTNLPPGSYRFRVKACNKDGVWNETGDSFSFTLLPRWHQTWLARLLAALSFALALVGGHRLRVRRLSARERELSARVREHTRELRQEVEQRRRTEESLQAEARERERAQQELSQLNEELGERVAERTSQLAGAIEELSAQKERLAVTLRSIGDGVIATDMAGTVILLNRVAEELIGWPRDEALGHPLGDVFRLVERWTRKPLPDQVAAVIASEKVIDLPSPALLVARDGTERLVSDSVAPIRDRLSRVTGAVLVFRDVSERIRIEEHLASVGKLESLGVLAAGIAHDFNNLLAGLFGYVDLARRDSPEGSVVHQRLSKALQVLGRARGLSSQLLTFTAGSSPVTTPTDLGALVRDGARFALAGSNVTSTLVLPNDLWPCEADASQISQVIDNLLINARQAMPEGGCIDVSAENQTVANDPILLAGRYLHLTVRDRGHGIAPELRDHVFDPFFTTKPGGTGLGLATSHSIVKKHGGHIEFDSVVGEGTTFHVLLPAAHAPGQGPAPALERLPALRGRVLVMDDDEAIREVLTESLVEIGLRVDAVGDGAAALDACRAALAAGEPFDLAILDLTIAGGIGGVETLARLRSLQPALVAVASSGYSSNPAISEPARHGFQATLVKPYLVTDVHRIVVSLLSR